MRGSRFLIAAAFTCLGCHLPPDVTSHPTTANRAFTALPPFKPSNQTVVPGNREKTLEYWKSVKRLLESKSTGEAAKEARRTSSELRAIPAVGVDPELLEHSEALARYLEQLVTIAEFAIENPASAKRQPGFEQALVESGHHTIDVSSQLRGLRSKLSQRYGIEFPAVRGPD